MSYKMNKYKTDLLDLRCMDCMELLRDTPDKAFDLAIVDPPYGINVNVSMGRRKGDKKSDYHKFAGGDSCAPDEAYFKELQRVSVNQIIWGENHFISRNPVDSACWVAWDKGFSDEVTFATFELAWTNCSGTCKMFRGHPNAQDRIHPTQKPLALYKWILHNYAKPGDTILDTHLGSCSIAIACHYAGYHLTGCELDEDYFKAGVERVKRETAQRDMFTEGLI
jgi:site-specific DNA-methyltransferase (adenine-specific)